jgi:hypothetical protein
MSSKKSDFTVFHVTFKNIDRTQSSRGYYTDEYQNQYKQMEKWCNENINERYWLFGSSAWEEYDYECWIPPKHAVMFKLRWC